MSSWNMQLIRIAEKGADARRAGVPIEACPYFGRTGFNRQRAEHWRAGWMQQPEADRREREMELLKGCVK